jgi:amidase
MDNLKFALYRSAAAEMLGNTLAKTQEPWPQGFSILESMVKFNDDINGNNDSGRQSIDSRTGPRHTPASVGDLWEAQTKRMLHDWVATKTKTETAREMDALLMPCTPWPASPKSGPRANH